MEELYKLYKEARKGSKRAKQELLDAIRSGYKSLFGSRPTDINYTTPPPLHINKRFEPNIRRIANTILQELRKRLKRAGINLKRVNRLESILTQLENPLKEEIKHLMTLLPPNGIITELERLEHVSKDDVVKFIRARELTGDCTSPKKEYFFFHTAPYYFASNAHVAIVHGKILRRKVDKRRGGKERYVEERKPLFVIYYYIIKDMKTGRKFLYLDSIQPTIHVRYNILSKSNREAYWRSSWIVPHLVETLEKMAEYHSADGILVPTITLSNEYTLQSDLEEEFKRRGAQPTHIDPNLIDLGDLPPSILDSPQVLYKNYRSVWDKLFLLYRLKKP